MKKILFISIGVLIVFLFFACATTDTAKWEDNSYKTKVSDLEGYPMWVSVTDEPVTGDMSGVLGPAHEGEEGWRMVYANKPAAKVMKSENYPFPVGAIIVKEAYPDENGGAGDLASITVMIKRANGYDPDHKNWEYMMLTPMMKVANDGMAQGKIEMCIGCHAEVEDKDYVFTTIGM